MKCRFFIGWMLLVMVSCTPVGTQDYVSPEITMSPELTAIDSLMRQQPDSAMALLCRDVSRNVSGNGNDTLGDVSGNVSTAAHDEHYRQILLAELCYKNDFVQSNRAQLRQAVAYFDSLLRVVAARSGAPANNTPAQDMSIAFLAARAHYTNGVGFYENDSVVEACKEYLKALEVMENQFEEKDLVGKKAKFMSLTYAHLMTLFSDQYLSDQVVYFGKLSLPYFKKHESVSWHLAWVLNQIGAHYEMARCLDSAIWYYQQAVCALTDTTVLVYRDIVSRQASLSYRMNKNAVGSLNRLHQTLACAKSDEERVARSLSIGRIFYQEKMYDSAWVYLDDVFHRTQNTEPKKQAAEWLVEICKVQGRNADAHEYADFLVPFANMHENQGFVKSQLMVLCQNYEQNKLEFMHQQKIRKAMRKTMVVVCWIALALLLGFIVYHFVNKAKHKGLIKQNEENAKLLEAERHAHKTQLSALSDRLKKSNALLRDASQQLENAMAKQNEADNNIRDDFAAFKRSGICSQILEVAEYMNFKPKIEHLIYKKYALDKKQLRALTEAADMYLVRFMAQMRKDYPSLNEEDLKYCCLYLLGLNEADISAFMQRAYSTVCERNRKIKRIMGVEKELETALRSMLKT